jgi:hypothetical protein
VEGGAAMITDNPQLLVLRFLAANRFISLAQVAYDLALPLVTVRKAFGALGDRLLVDSFGTVTGLGHRELERLAGLKITAVERSLA